MAFAPSSIATGEAKACPDFKRRCASPGLLLRLRRRAARTAIRNLPGVSLKRLIDERFAYPRVRPPERPQSKPDVEQVELGGALDQADGADDEQAFRLRDLSRFLFIQ